LLIQKESQFFNKMMHILLNKMINRVIVLEEQHLKMVFNGVFQLLNIHEVQSASNDVLCTEAKQLLEKYFNVLNKQSDSSTKSVFQRINEKLPLLEGFFSRLTKKNKLKSEKVERLFASESIKAIDTNCSIELIISMDLKRVQLHALKESAEGYSFCSAFKEAYGQFLDTYIKDALHLIPILNNLDASEEAIVIKHNLDTRTDRFRADLKIEEKII